MNYALKEYFDAVVMLTWSNWKTEPRSNRYHYASRFALELPVLFAQQTELDPTVVIPQSQVLFIEASGHPGIDLVHVDTRSEERSVQEFLGFLRARGIKRPFVWVYNTLGFAAIAEALRRTGSAFVVYHATEDYFTRSKIAPLMSGFSDSVRAACQRAHVVIGVSDKVTNVYLQETGVGQAFKTVANGCDALFARRIVDSCELPPRERRVAIYQGGVNSRLDFALLHNLIHRLPHWDFWFCGKEDNQIVEWNILKSHPNVTAFGDLSPQALGEKVHQATVGLIPFVQDDWIKGSFPLKAFEYVSYGLPVVSVPISALEEFPELFSFATNGEQFALALEQVSPSRYDALSIQRRLEFAQSNDYDVRFEKMQEIVVGRFLELSTKRKLLNVLVLYDDRSTFVSTIREHLEAFQKYSRYNIYYLPATSNLALDGAPTPEQYDFSIFDVVIIHYSVRLSLVDHLNEVLANSLERYYGLKVLFIQDEYDRTETARCWLDRLQFDIVYTCVPEEGLHHVYPPHRFPSTSFLPTLTGYVPESEDLDRHVTPVSERKLVLAYRGRKLPFIYGRLGNEKYRIGVDVKKFALANLLPVDIEVDDSKRIYGPDWYRFMASARATLGTESGANIFDLNGEISERVNAILQVDPDIDFDEMEARVLHQYESPVRMNQASPKIFEAIRLRTALVLFEGTYSGVVEPHRHFIPLKKDYSNIQEVFDKLQDVGYLEELTDRAYVEVVASGKFSYQTFVEGVDRDISRMVLDGPRCEILSIPVLAHQLDGTITSLYGRDCAGALLADRIIGNPVRKEEYVTLFGQQPSVTPESDDTLPMTATIIEQEPQPEETIPISEPVRTRSSGILWRMLPNRLRRSFAVKGRELYLRHLTEDGTETVGYRTARRFFRSLPYSVRERLLDRLKS